MDKTESGKAKGIVVFGGGTATNILVDIFNGLREARGCELSYIIPISDNGGSSSELIRVFGGPGIGDIRSRLVRLIPHSDSNADMSATKALFNHRLSSDPDAARVEWLDIVEGRHVLWTAMSSEKRELVRSFFNTVNLEIVKRARPPSSTFNFGRAAVGNLFLTGARLFSGSLESAIYLLEKICEIPRSTKVVPAINTNFTHHISAGLADGTVITGQNSISHPAEPTALPDSGGNVMGGPTVTTAAQMPGDTEEDPDLVEDANLPGSLPTLRKQYINFSKTHEEDLPARIQRAWYINPYGHEIRPRANPKVVSAIERAGVVVYSIGSLYTSLVPSLILRGVGKAIRESHYANKVLILNSSNDRETGAKDFQFSAWHFVRAIVAACEESQGEFHHDGENDNSQEIAELREKGEVTKYVTHLIHLEGEGTPMVDKADMVSFGVECIRVYGRKSDDGVLRYDEAGLTRALEVVVGRADVARSRRNTKV